MLHQHVSTVAQNGQTKHYLWTAGDFLLRRQGVKLPNMNPFPCLPNEALISRANTMTHIQMQAVPSARCVHSGTALRYSFLY